MTRYDKIYTQKFMTHASLLYDLCLDSLPYILRNFACFLSSDLFNFFEKFFPENNQSMYVSNSLDPDQTRQNVGLDLDPNCLQK